MDSKIFCSNQNCSKTSFHLSSSKNPDHSPCQTGWEMLYCNRKKQNKTGFGVLQNLVERLSFMGCVAGVYYLVLLSFSSLFSVKTDYNKINPWHFTGLALLCVLSCSVVSSSLRSFGVACQATLSMGFPRQKYWSGLSCPPAGDLPNSGI